MQNGSVIRRTRKKHSDIWQFRWWEKTSNGKTAPQACKGTGIVEQTYFRWRKEYGGLQVDQMRRLKELEQENSKLKRLVAELSLDKLVLKDLASGNF